MKTVYLKIHKLGHACTALLFVIVALLEVIVTFLSLCNYLSLTQFVSNLKGSQ